MGSNLASALLSAATYLPIDAVDSMQLSELVGEWEYEFIQLQPGKFHTTGAMVALDGVSIVRMASDRTLLQRGCAPPNMVAVMMPGPGTGQAFAHGQLVGPGECVTVAKDCALQEAITHAGYLDVSLAFDLNACRSQLDALNGGSIGVSLGTTIAAPGPSWIGDMLARVDWLMAAARDHPQSVGNDQVRASLADHLLAAMARFEGSPADVDSTTRAARAGRRVAVRLAREFIAARLSEPLRLSELCRHARLNIRSLEYGFREVTGLTPVAYVRSLRLNAVKRALLQDSSSHSRSISEIAMDAGFWHLSQFAMDYRLFFGETPTETRRRNLTRNSSHSRETHKSAPAQAIFR
jgi:AraC family transcriptional regulator, ethanolamine operon transcriptional activator